MVRILIILVIYILSICKTCAQDPAFSTSLLVPEILNPAFTAYSEKSTVGLIHRSQWPNLDLQVDSEYAFINTWNERINSGIGISFINQRQNFFKFNFNQILLSYAYKVQLTEELIFRPAIQIGWGENSFNSNTLNFEDQIDILNGVVNPISVEFSNINEKTSYFDFSAGMIVEKSDFFCGVSLKHLNKPSISFLSNGISPLDMFFSVNIGYQFTIADYIDIVQFPYETRLKLTSNFISQGDLKKNAFGAVLDFSNYYFGLGNNLNLNKNQTNTLNSFYLFGGLNYDHFQFGYSYDFKGLKGLNTGGAHEFSILYRFDLNKDCFSCP